MTLDKLLSWAGVLGAQQLYLPAPHGKRQGSICHDDKWRIDPSSYPDVCLVDNMAVWWFRATCFHGLEYLCVNREVLKTKLYYENRNESIKRVFLPYRCILG